MTGDRLLPFMSRSTSSCKSGKDAHKIPLTSKNADTQEAYKMKLASNLYQPALSWKGFAAFLTCHLTISPSPRGPHYLWRFSRKSKSRTSLCQPQPDIVFANLSATTRYRVQALISLYSLADNRRPVCLLWDGKSILDTIGHRVDCTEPRHVHDPNWWSTKNDPKTPSSWHMSVDLSGAI